MDPKGKVAVVSGGNSGLGEGGVKRLLAEGATVVSLDVAGQAPEGAEFIECDVSDEGSVERGDRRDRRAAWANRHSPQQRRYRRARPSGE